MLTWLTRLPAPEANELETAASVNETVPVPMNAARSPGAVNVTAFVSVAGTAPKSLPLVPPKSTTPSNAEALKDWVEVGRSTRPPTPGPLDVSVPSTFPTTVAGAGSRLSTWMRLVKVPVWTRSTDVSVPRAGSNCAAVPDWVKLVGVSANVTLRDRVVGATWTVRSDENWYAPDASVVVEPTTTPDAFKSSIGLLAIGASPLSNRPLPSAS